MFMTPIPPTRRPIEEITRLPSREVLIGQVIGLLLGPAREVLSLLSTPGTTLVGQLEALAKRGEDAGSDAIAAPEEAAPAAPEEAAPAAPEEVAPAAPEETAPAAPA